MRISDIKISKAIQSVTNEEKWFVLKYAKLCMKELSKSKYELPKMNGNFGIELHGNYGSRGGAPYIKIGLAPLRKKWTRHMEYATFADDPVIGTIHKTNPEIVQAAIVAHEIAHHVQYKYAQYRRVYRGYRKPHGEVFRLLYGFLRGQIINPLVKEAGGYIGKKREV